MTKLLCHRGFSMAMNINICVAQFHNSPSYDKPLRLALDAIAYRKKLNL